MKGIFWRKIPCECAGVQVEAWERRNLGESLRLLFLVPFAWIAVLAEWTGVGDVFAYDYDDEED